MVLEFSVMVLLFFVFVFFSRVASLFLYNAQVILKTVVGLGLFL